MHHAGPTHQRLLGRDKNWTPVFHDGETTLRSCLGRGLVSEEQGDRKYTQVMV